MLWVDGEVGRIEIVNLYGSDRVTFYEFTGANQHEGPVLVAATAIQEARSWALARGVVAVARRDMV
jgi:hypothetical protein